MATPYNDYYIFQNLLNTNYKHYDDILGQCLPHYIVRKDSNNFYILNEIFYSTVGSSICDSKQEDFIKNIINILNEELTKENKRKYASYILYAVALFQLSEDVNMMGKSTDKILQPTLGYWFTHTVKYFYGENVDNNNKWSLITQHMITELRQDLADFTMKMLNSLVSVCFNSKGENYDEIIRYSKFTYPQIGMLLLCNIAGLYNMKRWLRKSNYYSKYRCGDISPYSKVFIPNKNKRGKKTRRSNGF